MKKIIFIIAACLSLSLQAAEEGLTLPNDAMTKLNGEALIISQQRGMQVYMNNCMGCHALAFQRYNRTAEDLKIPEEVMLKNLIFSDGKIGDQMTNNMPVAKAKNWFGAAPPDLSVITRSRKPQWVYNYMRGFYADEERPYGVNNSVFADVGMPHVLEEMQGLQGKTDKVKSLENEIKYAKEDKAIANKQLKENPENSAELNKKIHDADKIIHNAEAQLTELAANGEYFTLIKEGQLSPEEFDKAMMDLVNFLDYIGEPIKLERQRLGLWVLLFIALFGIVAYMMKKEFWKDVH
ncbi:MAG: cytochrome c1 [Gammaproteobacteria bacterium]|nr:cytochrome c1 [Gammaproteobacteria bacterium]MDH5630380.1 cytochrome c1 [Gammaproteobacteria bacterium]